jgi:FKBP-type peptidyl-prolyl cis-trans isomerase FkpA
VSACRRTAFFSGLTILFEFRMKQTSRITRLLASALLLAAATATVHAATPAKQTLPSGVIVETIKAGTGVAPKATDTVLVHYSGTLVDGTEFDSSYKRGKPTQFPLNRVVPCWTEGIQHVKVGGKAKLTCPSATAYGANGIPGVIPPDAKLTFTVELMGVL